MCLFDRRRLTVAEKSGRIASFPEDGMPKGKESRVDLTPTVAALARWIGDAVSEGIARSLRDMPLQGANSEHGPFDDPLEEQKNTGRSNDPRS